MSEFRGEGVYARWDFDDEIEMIEEALSECDTEDEFIKSVVGGLCTLVDFNEQAEEELDEAAGNKKLTNIEKIAKKFPELNLLKESVDCVNVVSDGQEVEVKPEGDRTTITISPVEEAPVEAPEEDTCAVCMNNAHRWILLRHSAGSAAIPQPMLQRSGRFFSGCRTLPPLFSESAPV